ncbi:MAG: hypothetical protein QMB51_03240 [Patescibacteria group bacterium]
MSNNKEYTLSELEEKYGIHHETIRRKILSKELKSSKREIKKEIVVVSESDFLKVFPEAKEKKK